MSRLNLQSRDPRFDLSIRLLVGQFCTVGSSPAADYHVTSPLVEPMHCRIGCRAGGGFIECFDDSVTIKVNGVTSSRSRIVHGDDVVIGPIWLKVENPDTQRAEVPTDVAPQTEDDPTLNPTSSSSSIAATATTDLPSTPEPIIIDWRGDGDTTQQARPDNDRQSAHQRADPADLPQAASAAESPPTTAQPPNEPFFEFDSVDSDNADLTAEDFDELEKMPLPADGQSEENLLPISNADPEVQTQRQALLGGNHDGKCWRWSGKTAVARLAALLSSTALNCFEVKANVQLANMLPEQLQARVEQREGPAIFLISQQDSNALTEFLFLKRWNDRMGHPGALGMSISLLPTRNIHSLFEHVDTIILIQNQDVEMLRISNQRE